MAHIVSNQNRFSVVTDDGLDPTIGKERGRWHSPATPAKTLKRSPRFSRDGPIWCAMVHARLPP